MKKNRISKRAVALVCGFVLLIGYCLLPFAADEMGLTDYAAGGIDRITVSLSSRPVDMARTVEITSQEEIEEILRWCSSQRALPFSAPSLGAGGGLTVNFYSGEQERFMVWLDSFFFLSDIHNPFSDRQALGLFPYSLIYEWHSDLSS